MDKEVMNESDARASTARNEEATGVIEARGEAMIGSGKSRTFWMWVCALTCLTSGVMCVIAVKLQSLYVEPVEEGGEGKPFDQPFWQTFVMFSGEALCLFCWLYDEMITKKKKGKTTGVFEFPTPADLTKRTTPFWWWVIPSITDLTGTSMINAAFTYTYGSTVQMLRNSVLIWSSLVTIVMIKRPLRVHEWLGIIIMTGGMVAASISAFTNPDTSSQDESKTWLGIVLALAGTVFTALQLILEEKIFEKTYSPAMKAVGIEGLSGWVITIFVILVCHYADWYRFDEGWYQMNHSNRIVAGNLWYLVVVFVFNASGLMTTFLGSGLLRSVIFSLRAPIVYLYELAADWQDFSTGGIISVILSSGGFLVYSYVIPFVNKKRTPKTHALMRKGIPCFCTKMLPDSDDQEIDQAQIQKARTQSVDDNKATSEV